MSADPHLSRGAGEVGSRSEPGEGQPLTFGIASPTAGRAQGVAFLLVTACGWGFTWPILKFLLSELPPFTMRTTGCLGGVVFAFALAWARGERLRPPRRQWRLLTVYATLNYGVFSVFTTLAVTWLQASQAVVITYTLPIWAALIAWPMLNERPTPTRVLAMLLGLAGVALLVGVRQFQASWTTLAGVLSGFLAASLFGLGTVIAKKTPLAMPPVAGVAWQAGLGTIPIFLFALTEHPVWSRVTPIGWLAITYVAVIPMVVAYLAWFRALRLLPASTAATGVLLAPAIGVFASAALLGEPLGPRQLLALAITLTGVGLAIRS